MIASIICWRTGLILKDIRNLKILQWHIATNNSTRVFVLTGMAFEITMSSMTQDLENLVSKTLHAGGWRPV